MFVFSRVLSPAVVKRDFPRHIGLMMGVDTMLVCVGPALSAATAVPFQHVLGGNWELVLVIWGAAGTCRRARRLASAVCARRRHPCRYATRS